MKKEHAEFGIPLVARISIHWLNVFFDEIVFSADGSLVLTHSYEEGTAKIWNSTSGENIFTLAHRGVLLQL